MLISCKFSIVGLHLLLMTHLAHTFVLLTANMEDVKKLASKFVSESLAEKIAEFIASATQEKVKKPGSNDGVVKAENSHQVSEENKKYNIERQGESEAQDNLKSMEYNKLDQNEATQQSDSASLEQTTESDFETAERPQHIRNIGRLEGPSLYASVAPYVAQQYTYPLEVHEERKNFKHRQQDENNKKHLDNKVNKPPTSKYAQDTGKKKQRKIKGHPHKLLSNMDNNDVTDFAETKKSLNDLINAGSSYSKRAKELTTKKAMYEFDQYVNKDHPKTEIIATSGSMALPKLSERKWWETPKSSE